MHCPRCLPQENPLTPTLHFNGPLALASPTFEKMCGPNRQTMPWHRLTPTLSTRTSLHLHDPTTCALAHVRPHSPLSLQPKQSRCLWLRPSLQSQNPRNKLTDFLPTCSGDTTIYCPRSGWCVLDMCSARVRHLLDACSTCARQLLDACSTSARHLLDTCSTPARHLLDTCSTSPPHTLNNCSRNVKARTKHDKTARHLLYI